MRQALVIGTGGHSRVVLSILMACQKHDIKAAVDLESPRLDEVIMGVSIIAYSNFLSEFSGRDDVDVFLAIGNNDLRRRWWEKVKALGFSTPNLISSNSFVDDCAVLGEANVICARAVVGPQAVLGNNNLINTAAIVEHEVSIKHHCHVAPSATIAGRSYIDSLCMIGAGATIINGVSMASETVIGAGATLIRTVREPGGVYIGVPAKRKETGR